MERFSGWHCRPTSFIQAIDGNLYGTAADGDTTCLKLGSVFKIDTSGTVSTVYNWTGLTFNGEQGATPDRGIDSGERRYLAGFGNVHAGRYALPSER